MATRTTTPPKTKAATRATTKRTPAKRAATAKTAPRKATARKSPARTKAAQASTATTALAALRRNVLPIAGALAAGAATAAALFFTRRANVLAEGHAAPDLETGAHPGPDDRAAPHFRPDMDAPMSPADRAALAPALANGDARADLRH
ncbi:hypothetical protein J2Y54_003184 [Sphingomonas sp. BE123]|uniref:hypothetical protein n=1 Tax=Sphingomonas sp. BE123 TaxID=2817842 RepID=UPI002859186E|nr:hypothetical protein [Sphingomonas sp. BE123]MDR6853664.1 hypothetical protein [Sphingomonas sp. BE123]